MSRKPAYKQALSIGTAVVLGFALFTGCLLYTSDAADE